jgi:hypothetical protein
MKYKSLWSEDRTRGELAKYGVAGWTGREKGKVTDRPFELDVDFVAISEPPLSTV